MLYWFHATLWKPEATRKAPPKGCRVAEKRMEAVGGSQEDWLFSEFRVLMAPGVREEGRSGALVQTGSRKASQAFRPPEASVDPDSFKGGPKLRVPHRSLDPEAGGGSDRAKVWSLLPSASCVAGLDWSGVELPETREAGAGAGRGGHRPLETIPMAAYKKTPKGLEPTWSFWMSPAFCLSPMFVGLGRPRGKRLSCDAPATGARSRPFRRSVFLRRRDGLPSMPISIPIKTSKTARWRSFWDICSDTCGGRFFSCGITAEYIAGMPSENASVNILACAPNDFPIMPRNSIRPNLFGTILSALWPTAFQEIWSVSKSSWILRSSSCANHATCFGRVFGHPICPGNKLSITYA